MVLEHVPRSLISREVKEGNLKVLSKGGVGAFTASHCASGTSLAMHCLRPTSAAEIPTISALLRFVLRSAHASRNKSCPNGSSLPLFINASISLCILLDGWK